jgi:signal transduction histidine kinase
VTTQGLRGVSIRVKLAVFAVAVVVLVVLGQTIQSLSKEAVIVQEEVSLRARLILMSVAGAVGPVWTDERTPDLSPYAQRISDDLDVVSLALVDPEGRVIAAHGEPPDSEKVKQVIRLRLRTIPHSFWYMASEPLEFQVASPVLWGSNVRGYLLCTFRSAEPAERLRAMVTGALWTALFWVGVGGGLTLWLARRLTEPLVRLADDLTKMEHVDYVVPAGGLAHGEIGVVQRQLVDLSTRLRDERATVRDLNEVLQHQINVVSADLEKLAAQRQAILDSVRDGILLVSKDGRVTAANGPARDFFGELDPTQPLWSRLEEPTTLQRAVERVVSLRRPTMVQVRTAEGPGLQRRLLRARIAHLAGEAGEAGSVVVIAEDTTEREQLEEQMQRSERLASIGALSAGLAHQIGNHLNSIKGYAGLLARGLADRHELASDLEAIQKEVRSAAELMDRVLLLARTRPPATTPLNVPTVVREALDFVRPQARQQSVVIEEDFPVPGCEIQGDPHLLMQAILNLLVNAIQALPEGGHLAVSSVCEGARECVIRIHDDGPGIPADVRLRIFDPFFTTKPVGKGTGLGLSIAQRIIELHGGIIRVESRVGEGSTFELSIPLTRQSPPSGLVPPGRGAEVG